MTDAYDAWALGGAAQFELLKLCGWRDGAETTAEGSMQNDLAAERVDAILTFVGLAKAHSVPRKLLPFDDRKGEWFAPGERVTVLGYHPGTVEAGPDTVRVHMDGIGRAVEFPRTAIAKEGEQWTPSSPR